MPMQDKMEVRTPWVTCSVTPGMLTKEWAVEMKTADGKQISLFASSTHVDEKNGLIQVNVLEKADDTYLVYLPADPFEVSSRFINVSGKDVKWVSD